jgi:hypothetical protein
MRTPPRPKPRAKVRIRFKGGPLNRRTGTTLNTPNYRDADGLPLNYRQGRDRIDATRALGAIARLYVLGEDHSTYTFLPDLLTEFRTMRIKTLLEKKAEHPDQADRIEAEILAIEDAAA